ncbi:proteophosphoglycan 5 [Saccharothrix xinjiangensis]|uniref:Proteophosphoglycan 5 n=1 Tax=Saccharothrix xinjiangensis TaxID=204798 RepID=A0ABV9XXK3_9PSEU
MREVQLPDPVWMRARWAAFAAVCAARGWGDSCHAAGSTWHYDDGGGNWADLVHVGAGRAVLLGHDHEYSETYHNRAAEYFGEPETDLLAGAPDWWAPPVRAAEEAGLWVGFAYGFEDGAWRRADYDADDGFDSVNPPFADEARCRELIDEFTRGHAGGAAVDALVAADADVTEELVAAVVGPGLDARAGAAAARAFLNTGPPDHRSA